MQPDSKSSPQWSVTVSRSIAVPAERLWEIIATPGVFMQTHPYVRDNPVEHWPGVGSRDTVCYYSGMSLHRRITRWMDGIGYDLEAVNPSGFWSADVQWRVRTVNPDRSELTIAIAPQIIKLAPRRLAPYVWRFQVRPFLSSYLDAVLRGFDYHATTGQAVRRNQFGSQFAFSPWTLLAR